MTSTIDARSERSRIALIQAGMVLLAENKNTSLSDVAQAAGVGRATLYRHFDTREQLIEAVARQCIGAFNSVTASIEKTASSYLDAIRLMFEKVMPMHQELTFIMKLDALVEDNFSLEDLYRQQDEELREMLKQCQKENSIRKDFSIDWLMALLDGLFIASWQMVAKHNIPHADAAKLAFESFCAGVADND
ncbi:TetR/AcrR family transcriptional regulator [Alteromonas naphthalenivorans]|uniref:HTH tetR-type domain-containing protein n=1 Tax=Alteromonas naphthalenivorans TaxID=715451 RepID=F5ZFX0_ALTNA|nr:TetR/AcrR family transcriptional regulator [Alteromonas naphthalenivorans]AEF05738.1 hypothetical protein ambt_21235 [Alteromonas naphthalenivorans]